jgi:hypothetical protein
VRQLPDIQNQAQAAVSTIRKDATLTPEERSAALEAIQAETQSTLNSLLGEKQARNYANNGGYWIRNLAPPQARP